MAIRIAPASKGGSTNQEIASVEYYALYNVSAALATGAGAFTWKGVPGMSLIVPAKTPAYISAGGLFTMNGSGLTSGSFGMAMRIRNIANNAVVATVQDDYMALTAGASLTIARSWVCSARLTSTDTDQSYAMDVTITGYGQNTTKPASLGNFYLFGGSGYGPVWMRATGVC